MTEPSPKYRRMVYEFEIEVTDVVTAHAAAMNWGRDEDGEPVMMGFPDDEVIQQVVTYAMLEGFRDPDRWGVRHLGGGMAQLRAVDESNPEWFESVTVPPMPRRRDDGTYADIPADA